MKLIAALAALWMMALTVQTPRSPFVPVGVWYGGGKARAPLLVRDPAPERDAWRKDLQTIRALGFNSVKCWVDWATTEPERGKYRFDALDQLLELADKEGLRVIVQLYTDSAPEWVGRVHPDASFVTDKGLRIGSQASPGFCLDHKAVRGAVSSFISAVAQRARTHASLYGFDVWSEPHIVNWVWFNEPVEFCYCSHTKGKFSGWLRKKYGSLAALNGAWYRTFSSWDDVEPPRFGTILSYTDFVDWKTFVADKLRDDLKMKADATRTDASATDGRVRTTRDGRGATLQPGQAFFVSSHSDVPAVLLSPLSGYGNPDDWWMTQVVDFYGTSIYPKHASSAAPWSPARLMSGLDGIRSAARQKGWWIGELQAGQGATGVRVANPVTGADLRLWGWGVLSRGARAISYYAWYPMSSGYESNGYGMIELDGTVTERARAAGAFAAVVDRNAALFQQLRPQPSEIAIVYNRLSYMAGGNTIAPGNTVRNSMMGFYRALFEANIQADFIHADEIAAGDASRYKAVVLGYPVMLSRPVAEALQNYVRGGGTLISEARPAWNDERGFANERIPGFGLDDLFGAREKVLRVPDPVEIRLENELPDPLASFAGQAIRGAIYAQHLTVTKRDARVLARFPVDRAALTEGAAEGDAAIVLSKYGKGQALLIGSFPAAAYEQDFAKLETTGRFLRALAGWAGVEPAIAISGAAGLVEARLLESSEAWLLLAINHDVEPRQAELRLRPHMPIAEWVNIETGAVVHFVYSPQGPTLKYQFAPRDVLALVIKKAAS